MLTFDPTVNMGNIFEILSILAGGLLVLLRLNNSVIQLGHDMRGVQEEIKKMGELMVAVAVQGDRLNSMSARLDTLDRRYDEIRRAS